jgi:transposase InsO family protein
MALKPEIARVFAENFAAYIVRKVWRQMVRERFPIARCIVEQLMREMGLQGLIRGKPVRTTRPASRLLRRVTPNADGRNSPKLSICVNAPLCIPKRLDRYH